MPVKWTKNCLIPPSMSEMIFGGLEILAHFLLLSMSKETIIDIC